MNDGSPAERRTSKADGPYVLIIAHTTTFLTELSLFGRLIKDRTTATPIFYCSFAHWTGDAFAQKCENEGTVCLLDPLSEHLNRHFPSVEPTGEPAMRRRGPFEMARSGLARLARKLPGVGPSFVNERLMLSNHEAELRDLFARVRPALVVLGGDMVGYNTALVVALAHENSIAVMIVPSTMSNGQEQAEAYYGDPNYHVAGAERELVARLFPKWVRRFKDKRLFRCPPGRLLAIELSGLAPPLPWVFNSGYADAVTMESEAMIDYYVDVGMSRKAMVLTGTLSDDEMARRIRTVGAARNELCRELDMDPKRPIFLSALVPDCHYMTGVGLLCDFKEYRQVVEFWIDSLASLEDCNRIIALHPSVDVESMRWIERDGIRISTWKTADMVPLCDVYIASISSTIRWAIGCGKPVVNFDVYRLRYPDFLGVPGVVAMEEQQEFRDALRRLVVDEDYRRKLADLQRAASSRWAMLDGRVGDRMMEVVARLSTLKLIDRDGLRTERPKDMVS